MMRMDSEHQDGDTSMGQGTNKIVLCTFFRQLEIDETPESLFYLLTGIQLPNYLR